MKTILTIILISFISITANAKQNYCKTDEDQSKFIIHIFGESYQNDPDKRQFLKGIQKLQLKFQKGDKVRIVNHIGIESQTKLDICIPGCEAKNMLDSILKNDCSVEIAKRDMVVFKRSYIKILKQALSLSGEDYNVIEHMISIDNFYRGRNIDDQQTLVFHSLLPSGVDPTKASSFDKSFVKATQSNKLSQVSLPNINFINPNRSKNTLKFWKDLELKKDKSGLNVKFKTKVID